MSLDKFGQVWTSLDKFGRVWTSLDEFGRVWTSLDETCGGGDMWYWWGFDILGEGCREMG